MAQGKRGGGRKKPGVSFDPLPLSKPGDISAVPMSLWLQVPPPWSCTCRKAPSQHPYPLLSRYSTSFLLLVIMTSLTELSFLVPTGPCPIRDPHIKMQGPQILQPQCSMEISYGSWASPKGQKFDSVSFCLEPIVSQLQKSVKAGIGNQRYVTTLSVLIYSACGHFFTSFLRLVKAFYRHVGLVVGVPHCSSLITFTFP